MKTFSLPFYFITFAGVISVISALAMNSKELFALGFVVALGSFILGKMREE